MFYGVMMSGEDWNDCREPDDVAARLAAAEREIAELDAALAEKERLLEEARQDARNALLEAYSDDLTGLLNLRGIKLVVDYYCNPEDLSSQGKKSAQFLINHIENKCHDAQSSAASPTEYRHGQNEGKGLLFVFDLNNLKEINDTYGHDAGDAYLLAFCKILKKFFRCSDFIAHARTGGDEFIAYLTETDLQHFGSRLSELRRELQEIEFEYEQETLDPDTGAIVTKTIKLKGGCAVGAAEIKESSKAGITQAKKAADKDMYIHKSAMKDAARASNSLEKAKNFLSPDFKESQIEHLNAQTNDDNHAWKNYLAGLNTSFKWTSPLKNGWDKVMGPYSLGYKAPDVYSINLSDRPVKFSLPSFGFAGELWGGQASLEGNASLGGYERLEL